MKSQLNPESQAHFESLKKNLETAGRFSPGDDVPLRRLAHLYSLIDRLETEMNQAWSEKFVKTNLALYDKLLKNVLALEVAFLLNPGSRSRSKMKPGKEKKQFGVDAKTKGS